MENQLRILVIDDDQKMIRVLTRELKEQFSVWSATSFSEALSLLQNEKGFQAVVSDLNLGPGPNGQHLLTTVHSWYPQCIRVLISGSFSPDNQKAILEDGIVDAVFMKPWRPGEILAFLRQALYY